MDSYDEIPYESSPVTETDPDRLAVIARLFGLESADPAGCSVLELGCAAGGNLVPLAWRNPGSRYLGIELSARQVADGRRLLGRLDLANIELRQGDEVTAGLLSALHHQPTAWRVTAERAMNRHLQGGCQVPIACYAQLQSGDVLNLRGLVGRPDGSLLLRAEGSAPVAEAEQLGVAVAEDLLAQGAADILAEVYGQ